MRGKGLLHRDLKPANILLVKKHRITDFKLCDFGFAEMVPKSGLSLLCGSPGYVAPEILNNENYSFQADIFSFGVILYILLSGRCPFPGKRPNEILQKNKECSILFYDKY